MVGESLRAAIISAIADAQEAGHLLLAVDNDHGLPVRRRSSDGFVRPRRP